MKNLKQIIFLFFALSLLAITGCKGGFGSGSGNNAPITDADVRKGLDGIAAEFIKNAPPEKVFEDSIFPIGINLENKGAFDIESGFLSIGLEKAYMDFLNENDELKNFKIKGKSIFNLNGDEEFITFNAQAKKVGAQSETHPSIIFATVCYPYKTILGTSVCVDTDIFGTGLRDKACEVMDLEFNGGQGAPVAITKIETRMFPDPSNDRIKPHFIIHVENKGNGEVIIPDQNKIMDACTSTSLNFNDFNRITIKAFLSNKELNCNIGDDIDNPELRLRDKIDIARCTLDEGIERNTDAFTSPLRIELDYGYTFTISKDITIEKILKY